MKCTNCKKEILDNCIYCTYCGEQLLNETLENTEVNHTVNNEKVYEDINNKIGECSTSLKENLPVYLGKFKNFIINNKLTVMISSIILVLLIGGLGIFSYMQGKPVNDNDLKQFVVGQSFYFEDCNIEITDSNLENLEVISRKSVKKQSDSITGEITINLDNAKVVSNFELQLLYNRNTKNWEESSIYSQGIKSIEPTVDLEKAVPDLLKDTSISYKNRSLNLSSGILKEISDIKIEENDNASSKNASAILSLSNGVINSKVSIEFPIYYNFNENKWSLNTSYIPSEVVENESISSTLSDEDKKKFILEQLDISSSYPYKYTFNNHDYSTYLTFTKENITNLTINNFMEYEKNTIRAEIQGEASSGAINKINFSGVVYAELSLVNNSRNKNDIVIDSVEVTSLNIDDIKTKLLKEKIDNTPITVAMADTLTLGEETEYSKIFDKQYEATITVNGESIPVKLYASLNLNNIDKKYEWTLSNFYKKR